MKYILYFFSSIGVVAISAGFGFVAYLVTRNFTKYEAICGYSDGAFTVVSCVVMYNILYKKQKT